MLNIYAIRDAKMETFNRPFYMPADGAAIRAFQDEVNNKESELNRHPEDYALYILGIFNEDTGTIEGNLPQKLSEASTLIYREGAKNAQE